MRCRLAKRSKLAKRYEPPIPSFFVVVVFHKSIVSIYFFIFLKRKIDAFDQRLIFKWIFFYRFVCAKRWLKMKFNSCVYQTTNTFDKMHRTCVKDSDWLISIDSIQLKWQWFIFGINLNRFCFLESIDFAGISKNDFFVFEYLRFLYENYRRLLFNQTKIGNLLFVFE